MRAQPISRRRVRRGRAFTIVEVLATMTLAAIVLPPAVHGVMLCLATVEHAKDQARAASLAQSKLAEILTNEDYYDAETTGDFGENLREYTWAARVGNWQDDRLAQVDVSVIWTRRGLQHDVTLSTLVYVGQPSE